MGVDSYQILETLFSHECHDPLALPIFLLFLLQCSLSQVWVCVVDITTGVVCPAIIYTLCFEPLCNLYSFCLLQKVYFWRSGELQLSFYICISIYNTVYYIGLGK